MITFEDNGVGGKRYYTDSIGGGALVWDTSLVSVRELVVAICMEEMGFESGLVLDEIGSTKDLVTLAKTLLLKKEMHQLGLDNPEGDNHGSI